MKQEYMSQGRSNGMIWIQTIRQNAWASKISHILIWLTDLKQLTYTLTGLQK